MQVTKLEFEQSLSEFTSLPKFDEAYLVVVITKAMCNECKGLIVFSRSSSDGIRKSVYA